MKRGIIVTTPKLGYSHKLCMQTTHLSNAIKHLVDQHMAHR